MNLSCRCGEKASLTVHAPWQTALKWSWNGVETSAPWHEVLRRAKSGTPHIRRRGWLTGARCRGDITHRHNPRRWWGRCFAVTPAALLAWRQRLLRRSIGMAGEMAGRAPAIHHPGRQGDSPRSRHGSFSERLAQRWHGSCLAAARPRGFTQNASSVFAPAGPRSAHRAMPRQLPSARGRVVPGTRRPLLRSRHPRPPRRDTPRCR